MRSQTKGRQPKRSLRLSPPSLEDSMTFHCMLYTCMSRLQYMHRTLTSPLSVASHTISTGYFDFGEIINSTLLVSGFSHVLDSSEMSHKLPKFLLLESVKISPRCHQNAPFKVFISKFSGGACPRTPLAGHTFGARDVALRATFGPLFRKKTHPFLEAGYRTGTQGSSTSAIMLRILDRCLGHIVFTAQSIHTPILKGTSSGAVGHYRDQL